MVNGTRKANAQKMEILPKLWCQKCGAAIGKIAIESSMQANGITHIAERDAPSRCGAPAPAAHAMDGNNNPASAIKRLEILLEFKKVNTALDSFILVLCRNDTERKYT